MDWQTKEYIDEKFSDIEEKLNILLEHFKLDQDEELSFADEELEETPNASESKSSDKLLL